MPSSPGARALERRLRELSHDVLTVGSRPPRTPARLARRLAAGGLGPAVGGRVVLLTGASSGIGEQAALRLGAAGARVVLVARSEDALRDVAARIADEGGTAEVRPCDLTDLDAIGRLTDEVLADHGAVDVLVNNAGRSIRRSIAASTDRMHDFERTMQLNYHGPVKLTLGLLPAMRAQGRGQIVNVLSEGLLLQTPRFSAYLASKAALDTFSRCVANEVRPDGVRVTGIHMPLVRTPMIAPTAAYDRVPTLRADEAADLVCEGIVTRAYAVTAREGRALQLARGVAPGVLEAGISHVARLLGGPDGPSPSGSPTGDAAATAQSAAPASPAVPARDARSVR